MVTVDKLKSYLRIDGDYEDELLQEFLTAAEAYLTGAVSGYSENYSAYLEFTSKADLLQMVLAAELYQNRDNSPHDMSYTVRSLMAQLQYFTPAEGNTDSQTVDGASDISGDTGNYEYGTIAFFDGEGNLKDNGVGIASDEEFARMLDEVGI